MVYRSFIKSWAEETFEDLKCISLVLSITSMIEDEIKKRIKEMMVETAKVLEIAEQNNDFFSLFRWCGGCHDYHPISSGSLLRLSELLDSELRYLTPFRYINLSTFKKEIVIAPYFYFPGVGAFCICPKGEFRLAEEEWKKMHEEWRTDAILHPDRYSQSIGLLARLPEDYFDIYKIIEEREDIQEKIKEIWQKSNCKDFLYSAFPKYIEKINE